ncbi:MAG: hypothetical protein HGGPFJEG_01566 [Ignavibacteria bacterium]|nr:hypothetical protein [Ignavibacteria bacterium]
MKVFFLILIFVFFENAFCRDDSLTVTDTLNTFKLNVYSQPENARVYLDTVLAGLTPLENYSVKEGSYKLRIINPFSLSGWENENYISDINISADTSVSVNFKYFYYFNSIPFDAGIFYNDSLFGITPFRFLSENKLSGSLTFKKSNFKDFIFNLDDYNFEKGVTVNLISKGKETVNDIVSKNKSTQFKTKRNLYYVLGFGALSLTGAFLSVNFKDVSNNNYEKYLITGDKYYLDESNKNDKYFIASVILMQLAIGGLIYFLFFD